jgi:hypothetical protein
MFTFGLHFASEARTVIGRWMNTSSMPDLHTGICQFVARGPAFGSTVYSACMPPFR